MQTDTVRPAAVTVYFAARRIISELSIHRDTVLSHARDVDRAANELGSIEKLRARITRRASSGADTSQQLAMIESALESAESGVATFYDVALAAIDWAENSLLLLNAADSPELSRAAMDIALALREETRPRCLGTYATAVHAVWGAVALLSDALKTATRESPPRHNERPIDEHEIRAVVADQKYAIRRIRDVLPDERLDPLFARADLEWKTIKEATKPAVESVTSPQADPKPAGKTPNRADTNRTLGKKVQPRDEVSKELVKHYRKNKKRLADGVTKIEIVRDFCREHGIPVSKADSFARALRRYEPAQKADR